MSAVAELFQELLEILDAALGAAMERSGVQQWGRAATTHEIGVQLGLSVAECDPRPLGGFELGLAFLVQFCEHLAIHLVQFGIGFFEALEGLPVHFCLGLGTGIGERQCDNGEYQAELANGFHMGVSFAETGQNSRRMAVTHAINDVLLRTSRESPNSGGSFPSREIGPLGWVSGHAADWRPNFSSGRDRVRDKGMLLALEIRGFNAMKCLEITGKHLGGGETEVDGDFLDGGSLAKQ